MKKIDLVSGKFFYVVCGSCNQLIKYRLEKWPIEHKDVTAHADCSNCTSKIIFKIPSYIPEEQAVKFLRVKSAKDVEEYLKNMEKDYPYKMGFDCGKKGANTKNCHFSIFSTPEKTKEWERGKADSEKKRRSSTSNA